MARRTSRSKATVVATPEKDKKSVASKNSSLQAKASTPGATKGSKAKVSSPSPDPESITTLDAKAVEVVEPKALPPAKTSQAKQKATTTIEGELAYLAHTLHTAQIYHNEGKPVENQDRHIFIQEVLSDIKIKPFSPSQQEIEEILRTPVGIIFFVNPSPDAGSVISNGLYLLINLEVPLSPEAGLLAIPDAIKPMPFGSKEDWKQLVALILQLNLRQSLYNQENKDKPQKVVDIKSSASFDEKNGKALVEELKFFRCAVKLGLSPDAGLKSNQENRVLQAFI